MPTFPAHVVLEVFVKCFTPWVLQESDRVGLNILATATIPKQNTNETRSENMITVIIKFGEYHFDT